MGSEEKMVTELTYKLWRRREERRGGFTRGFFVLFCVCVRTPAFSSIRHKFCNLLLTSSVVFSYAMHRRICSFYVIMPGKELTYILVTAHPNWTVIQNISDNICPSILFYIVMIFENSRHLASRFSKCHMKISTTK